MSTNQSNYHEPIIGIDFGTTKTMVAEYDPVKTFAKVRKMGRGGDEMPSSIYVTDGGEVLFGDDADDEGIHDSSKHIRRFKMLLGKTTETNFGQKSAKPTDLATEFLSHVRARLETEVCHRAVEQVVLTVPAMFGPAQRKDLTNAAERAGFKRVELLPEPVAAGIAYCNHHTDLSKNLRFLVVDWGGGTFDLAVVERNGADECKVLLEYVGGAGDIGGEDLDDELWIAVSKLIEDLGFQSLAFQPKHEWGKYRRDLTRVKEGLSAKTQVTASFTLDGGKLARVPIDRSKLEQVIHEKVYQGAGQVAEIVKRCRDSGCNLDFILLAGGTSRIPMIPSLLEQTAGLPCRTWSEGRDAIALGAAIHAHRILEPRAKPPEPAAAQSSSHDGKFTAMSQYKSLLEGAWIDGVISNDERAFLSKKRKELGLSIEESKAIQIQVLGASIEDLPKPEPSNIQSVDLQPSKPVSNNIIQPKEKNLDLILHKLDITTKSYSEEFFYVRPNIPHNKKFNATQSYAPNVQFEEVLILHDASLFRNGKTGFIITKNQFYWKNNFESPNSILTKHIKKIAVIRASGTFSEASIVLNDHKISISNNKHWGSIGENEVAEAMLQFLKEWLNI